MLCTLSAARPPQPSGDKAGATHGKHVIPHGRLDDAPQGGRELPKLVPTFAGQLETAEKAAAQPSAS
jgi:hypothetical protein